jgi:hypothetical protein
MTRDWIEFIDSTAIPILMANVHEFVKETCTYIDPDTFESKSEQFGTWDRPTSYKNAAVIDKDFQMEEGFPTPSEIFVNPEEIMYLCTGGGVVSAPDPAPAFRAETMTIRWNCVPDGWPFRIDLYKPRYYMNKGKLYRKRSNNPVVSIEEMLAVWEKNDTRPAVVRVRDYRFYMNGERNHRKEELNFFDFSVNRDHFDFLEQIGAKYDPFTNKFFLDELSQMCYMEDLTAELRESTEKVATQSWRNT